MFQDENAVPQGLGQNHENMGKHKSSAGENNGAQEPAQKRVALAVLNAHPDYVKKQFCRKPELEEKPNKMMAQVERESLNDFITDSRNEPKYYFSNVESEPYPTDDCRKMKSLNLRRPPLSVVQDMDTEYDDDSVRLLSFEDDNLSEEEETTEERELSKVVSEDSAFKERQDRLMMLSDYRDEVILYLREAESRFRAKPQYMRKQPDITSHMRCIMVDWMVEVAEEYKLKRETLFLSVNYVDRFLSQMSVLRGKLQLVGTAAMFIASKYEEIYPPEVAEFAYITDSTYTEQQVIRMEYLMLRALSFDLATPTPNCFCERYLSESGADEKVAALSMYLLELTLLDDVYLEFLPSIIACSAICLASYTLSQPSWTKTLREVTGYEIVDFETCLRLLHQTHCATPSLKQQALKTKYSHTKFFEVSSIEAPSFLML